MVVMEYHKIQTIWKRDEKGKIIPGDWTLPEFEYLQHNKWYFTEKVDGTNIRIERRDGVFRIGGRTDNAQLHSQLVHVLSTTFQPLNDASVSVFAYDNIALYGEGYGAGIQKGGGLYRPDKSFVLFDVKVGDSWLDRNNVNDVAATLGIDAVPSFGHGTLLDAVDMVRPGLVSHWGPFESEGLVCRPATELYDRRGHRVICKIKTCDYRNLEC